MQQQVESLSLCRWRLVVHGGVDVYSRIPVYLHCSNNNRADTVLELFREAVTIYGLRSRIRIDKGGENVDVAMYLLTHPLRGPGRSTVIVVCITRESKGCGEMCIQEYSISTMASSATCNQFICSTLTMPCTFFVYISYIFHE